MIDDDVFSLTNLLPSTTGLPMTVWIGPRRAKSEVAHLLLNPTHGARVVSCLVAIEPTPRLLKGYLSERDVTRVMAWVETNSDSLLAYWRGEIDGDELVRRLTARLEPTRIWRTRYATCSNGLF